ncbi:MAG: hypothetical protein HY400_07160 [Elusimicrobia bacterium]|nr:hypothetical protein [Elusimicrobiota bacterium]
MVNFLVVTHGEFGAYLVEAAEGIVGAQMEGIHAMSLSPRQSLSEIKSSLSRLIEDLRRTPDGLLILTDMVGGTPTNVLFPLVKDLPGVEILSGVNLYMLVVAFNNRKSMKLDALMQKILEDGKKSIRDIKALFATQVK